MANIKKLTRDEIKSQLMIPSKRVLKLLGNQLIDAVKEAKRGCLSGDADKAKQSYAVNLYRGLSALEQWTPSFDLDKSKDDKGQQAGWAMIYKVSKNKEEASELLAHLSKNLDSLVTTSEKTSQHLLGMLKFYFMKFDPVKMINAKKMKDEEKARSYEVAALQTLKILNGKAFLTLVEGHNEKDNFKFYSHVVIDKIVSEKAIVKACKKKMQKVPTPNGQWETVRHQLDYFPKTALHKKLEHGAVFYETMDLMASWVWTIREVTREEIVDYLMSTDDFMNQSKYDHGSLGGRVRMEEYIQSVLKLIGKPFHLPAQPVASGRMKYLFNDVQADEFRSNLFQQFDKELITDDDARLLKWNMYNEFYRKTINKPKMSEVYAVRAFDKNVDAVLSSCIDSGKSYGREIVKAYHCYLDKEPTGFLVDFDQTNGAYQIQGGAVLDEKALTDSNMYATVKIMDVYLNMATQFSIVLTELLLESIKLNRDDLKDATTVGAYGAGGITMLNAHRGSNPSLWTNRLSKLMEDDNKKYIGDKLIDTFATAYPVVMDAQHLANEEYRKTISEYNTHHTITFDDGYIGQFLNYDEDTIEKQVQKKGKATKGNIVKHKIWFIKDDCKVGQLTVNSPMPNPHANTTNAVAIGTHGLDGFAEREVIRRTKVQLLGKHDAYRATCGKMRKILNEYPNVMGDMAEKRMWIRHMNEVAGKEIKFVMGNAKTDKIYQSRNGML